MMKLNNLRGTQAKATVPATEAEKAFTYENLLDVTYNAIEMKLTDSQLRYLKKLLEKA